MGKLEKRVRELLNLPAEVRYEDVEKVMEAFGWELVNVKGSHRVFSKGEEIITIPVKKGRNVKKMYIKRIIQRLNLEEWYEEHKG